MDNQPQHMTDILADCLDAIQSGRLSPQECAARYPDQAAELAALLQTAQTIEREAVARPSPAFRQAARARLLEKLPDQPAVTNGGFFRPIGQIHKLRQRRFAMNILAILAILVATVLGGGGAAYAASGDALPGDALYGVKTGVENLQLALADDAQDLNLYNQFLNRRTMELRALVEAERFDDLEPAAVRYEQNLAAMVQTMLENPELGEMVMDQLRLAQQDRLQTMTQLMDCTPAETQARIRQMLHAEMQQLSPGLGEPGFGPGEPGLGGNEPAGPGVPGQGPGQPGGPEEGQGGGPGSPGAGEPQGNGEPGMGGNEPAGTAIPGQGEPGFGPGEPGLGDCEQGTGDCEPLGPGEPGQGPGQPGGSDESGYQSGPQGTPTPRPGDTGQSGSGSSGSGSGQGGSDQGGSGQGGNGQGGNGQGGSGK